MFTITNSVIKCPTCRQVIHPSNINEYSDDDCFYQFDCLSLIHDNVKQTAFFKCRICTSFNFSAVLEPRRLHASIIQHALTNKHQTELGNLHRNNNYDFDIETQSGMHNNNTIDDIDDGIINGYYEDIAFDPTEPSFGIGCNADSSHDVNMGAHLLPTNPISISTNDDYIEAIHHSPAPVSTEITKLFDEVHKSYFDACVKHVGHQFITNQAITRSPNAYHSEENASMSLYTLLLSKLSIEMSSTQRQILATLLSHAFHSARDRNSKLFVPSCGNDIRKKLLEGKHSVKANLPIPQIVELAEGFIYIPMKSTIKHQFCSEDPPNPFLPFSHSVHANTPRGKELLDPSEVVGSMSEDHRGHPIFPIKLLPWTDDFEVHNVVKTTGASAHLGFVTIGAQDGDHSGKHTHLLWIGPQKALAAEAERMFTDELNDMSKNPFPVYSRKHNCIVDVKPKMYAFLADRPDKSKRLSMLSGGNTHACWSYCGEYINVIDQAVLCTTCFSRLMMNKDIGSEAVTPCDICFSLDFQLMKYKAHDDFPKDMIPADDPPLSSPSDLIPFKKVTIEHMKWACLTGFDKIKRKVWTQKNLMCFLRCQGINIEYSKCIYANGVNAALYHSNSPNSPELEKQQKSDPASFRSPEIPPLWGIEHNFGVDVFVDCPMHLLFLGTYKSLNKIHLPRFLTPISKKTTAIKCINQRLEYITDGVTQHMVQSRISYLPLHPSCGSTDITYGSWLSKNWISHQRISKWIHADLPTYSTKDVNKSDLGKDYCMYKLPQIRRWCTTRGVEFPPDLKKVGPARIWFVNIVTDYKKLFSHYSEDEIFRYIQDKITADLYEDIQKMTSTNRQDWFDTYVESQKKHPPEVPTNFDVESIREDIQDLLSLHLCIVSRVMHGCSGKSVGRHVKLYLTIFHRVDKALGTKKNVPTVIKQMNLITLMNLEPTIDRFGPLRLLWEGGGMGEGSIPKVKKFIHDMKPNFAKNAAASHLQKLALDNLLASAFKEVRAEMAGNDDDEQQEHYERLLKSVTESTEKESNRNGVPDSFVCSGELDKPFSGVDLGGEKAAVYKTHGHDPQLCPIWRGDLAVPVVIDVNDNGIFIAVKDGTLVRVHLSQHGCKQLLDGSFFYAKMLQSGTLKWTEKKRGELVCGLMLRHPDLAFCNHYYVIAMNWMEAAFSINQILFRLPRFRGATYEDGADEKSSQHFSHIYHRTNNNKRHFQQTVMTNQLEENNVER
jgi:hypothetical protein